MADFSFTAQKHLCCSPWLIFSWSVQWGEETSLYNRPVFLSFLLARSTCVGMCSWRHHVFACLSVDTRPSHALCFQQPQLLSNLARIPALLKAPNQCFFKTFLRLQLRKCTCEMMTYWPSFLRLDGASRFFFLNCDAVLCLLFFFNKHKHPKTIQLPFGASLAYYSCLAHL